MQDYVDLGFHRENIIIHPNNSEAFLADDLDSLPKLFEAYGLEITGAPIGSPQFVINWLLHQISELQQEVDQKQPDNILHTEKYHHSQNDLYLEN